MGSTLIFNPDFLLKLVYPDAAEAEKSGCIMLKSKTKHVSALKLLNNPTLKLVPVTKTGVEARLKRSFMPSLRSPE